MIKGITQGKYITVTGGQPGSNYVNNYSGAQGVGNMRFNTSTQNIEIWDGSNWVTFNTSYATVGLSPDAEILLDWAKVRMHEEQEMKALAEKHPAVAIALENLNKAQQQLKATIILSKEYQTNEEPAS